jgi:hypothetical protein
MTRTERNGWLAGDLLCRWVTEFESSRIMLAHFSSDEVTAYVDTLFESDTLFDRIRTLASCGIFRHLIQDQLALGSDRECT